MQASQASCWNIFIFVHPQHARDGHHESRGVMRERRAAGDPYWSYSGELSCVYAGEYTFAVAETLV
uniref:Uncharacterized protein n=1 Tax=Sphaeramia orbicularis TaxID=375764 RepID=A0A673AH76_9TELE